MSTKTIIVLSTLIGGKKQYVAGGITRHGHYPNKVIVHHTTDLHGYAKEFTSTKEAEDFIPTIHNPHERHYEVAEETLEFKSRKARNDYERIL